MGIHMTELSRMSENNQDIQLQLDSEMALSAEMERMEREANLDEWMKAQADLYINESEQTVDEETLDRLEEEVGF